MLGIKLSREQRCELFFLAFLLVKVHPSLLPKLQRLCENKFLDVFFMFFCVYFFVFFFCPTCVAFVLVQLLPTCHQGHFWRFHSMWWKSYMPQPASLAQGVCKFNQKSRQQIVNNKLGTDAIAINQKWWGNWESVCQVETSIDWISRLNILINVFESKRRKTFRRRESKFTFHYWKYSKWERKKKLL